MWVHVESVQWYLSQKLYDEKCNISIAQKSLKYADD